VTRTGLAAVIARTGLDPWDAHAAAVADAAICPVLTLDAAKWRQYAEGVDEPLHIIEIANPDAAPVDGAGALREACRGPVRAQSSDGRYREFGLLGTEGGACPRPVAGRPGQGAGQRGRAVGGQVQQYRRGQAAGAFPQQGQPGWRCDRKMSDLATNIKFMFDTSISRPAADSAVPLERLEAQICELAGHLAAATCRFLVLLGVRVGGLGTRYSIQ
jgi:hypothetical protein